MSLHLVRWWVGLLGGVLMGGGLVLHGQIAFARYSKEGVDSVFVLWRAIGELTFFYQDETIKTALWAKDAPDSVLLEFDKVAWTLVVLGAAVSFGSLFLQRSRKPGDEGAGKGGKSKSSKAKGKAKSRWG